MLQAVFKDILDNKKDWLQSSTGEQFEQRFERSLKSNGFNRIQKQDVPANEFKIIKSQILEKLGSSLIKNPFKQNELKDCFIYQPFGPQNYPDFLVFTKNFIVPVEIKYSSKRQIRPVWNSNLPKDKAIYIFGSFGKGDVTFFWGGDALPQDERKELVEVFDEIKKSEQEYKDKQIQSFETKKMKIDRGFTIYVRRAFDQNKLANKKANLNFFTHPNRKQCEENVISELPTLN